MTRETLSSEIQNCSFPHLVLCVPTGYGKSKLGLNAVFKNNPKNLLIVVPRNVLKSNWKEEIIKWGYESHLSNITFTTYASLQKYVVNEIGKKIAWDAVIFDECHHLSERVQEIVSEMNIRNAVMLSATLKLETRQAIRNLFHHVYFFTVRMKDAITDEVLPDPEVILIPLKLESSMYSLSFELHTKAKGKQAVCKFEDRFKYSSITPLKVLCTQKQYHYYLESMIDSLKRKSMGNEIMKKRWLGMCGARLKWLSSQKTEIVKKIQSKFSNERTLTFCSSIEQTEQLGSNCINSKNKKSLEILSQFNEGLIDHITSCNMLNEGCNLTSCRVGIYANLNSSEIIIKQRLGRILRHKNPLIIIPYFKDTRDEELVQKMMQDYNQELVSTMSLEELLSSKELEDTNK